MSRHYLKAIIISKGYSLKEFAELMGTNTDILRRKLTGKTKINIDDIRIICKILNKSPLEIFFPEWLQK